MFMNWILPLIVTVLFDIAVLYLLKKKNPFGKSSSLYKKIEYSLGVLILFVISLAIIRASITYLTR